MSEATPSLRERVASWWFRPAPPERLAAERLGEPARDRHDRSLFEQAQRRVGRGGFQFESRTKVL